MSFQNPRFVHFHGFVWGDLLLCTMVNHYLKKHLGFFLLVPSILSKSKLPTNSMTWIFWECLTIKPTRNREENWFLRIWYIGIKKFQTYCKYVPTSVNPRVKQEDHGLPESQGGKMVFDRDLECNYVRLDHPRWRLILIDLVTRLRRGLLYCWWEVGAAPGPQGPCCRWKGQSPDVWRYRHGLVPRRHSFAGRTRAGVEKHQRSIRSGHHCNPTTAGTMRNAAFTCFVLPRKIHNPVIHPVPAGRPSTGRFKMHPIPLFLGWWPKQWRIQMFWQPRDAPRWRIIPFRKWLFMACKWGVANYLQVLRWFYKHVKLNFPAILCDLSGMVQWPLQSLSDLEAQSLDQTWSNCRDSRCSKHWTYGRGMWCEIYGYRWFFSLWCALVFLHLLRFILAHFGETFPTFFCWVRQLSSLVFQRLIFWPFFPIKTKDYYYPKRIFN